LTIKKGVRIVEGRPSGRSIKYENDREKYLSRKKKNLNSVLAA